MVYYSYSSQHYIYEEAMPLVNWNLTTSREKSRPYITYLAKIISVLTFTFTFTTTRSHILWNMNVNEANAKKYYRSVKRIYVMEKSKESSRNKRKGMGLGVGRGRVAWNEGGCGCDSKMMLKGEYSKLG